MDTASSVSKGCFAYKGKKKYAKVEDYIETSGDDSKKKSHMAFQVMWEEVDTLLQILQADMNTKIFEDLLKFASHSQDQFRLSDTTSHVVNEIPTAALVTGVNTPDHGVMFSNLVAMLKERISPLVAILKSKDCATVKSTLSRTLSQLLDNPQLLLDEDDEEEMKTKHLPLTLSTLAKWYRNKYGKNSPPKKRKSVDGTAVEVNQCPPVVIVFEDFESFLPHVIQDYITIASTYLSQVPFVFVFGIATSVSAVHRLLPNAVSSLLCMEKFQAPPSTEYLSLVINQILMTPQYPFKLGAKVFQLLLDIFLYHDFSVLNFIKGLRFAMLDHYFNTPVSYLCCPLDQVDGLVKKIPKDCLDTVRKMPSFMRHVEQASPKEQKDLLIDEKFTKERVVELVRNLHQYHTTFFPVLRCLHTLVAKLPRHPLGKQMREVYSLALESNIFELEDYKQAMELLRLMSKDELVELVRQSLIGLSNDTPEELADVLDKIQTFLNRFDTLDELMDVDEQEEEEAGPSVTICKQKNIEALKQTLNEIRTRKKRASPYEKLRAEVVDYFHSVFTKYLVCPRTLALHELLYYNSASAIKQHLNASPRSAIQTALSNPQQYLQCECCKCSSGRICASMPDVCIVYRLHLECGQLINLYDWLQAFVTVVSEDDENGEAKPDKVLQARFIRAVSELQFLGFIKPTKRKTDHVARLTWGGC